MQASFFYFSNISFKKYETYMELNIVKKPFKNI